MLCAILQRNVCMYSICTYDKTHKLLFWAVAAVEDPVCEISIVWRRKAVYRKSGKCTMYGPKSPNGLIGERSTGIYVYWFIVITHLPIVWVCDHLNLSFTIHTSSNTYGIPWGRKIKWITLFSINTNNCKYCILVYVGCWMNENWISL